ncbi:vitellin-degrading protease-like [Anticarsia gemmatalis]|uniref:vitellin-degrading protease-like n=1 Tax=Anticarsia gemmatalis TaxID=129554 RepID=UPI003F76367A
MGGYSGFIMLNWVFCLAFVSCVVSTPTIKSLEEIRIVGGEDVDIMEAPYQVSLVRRGRHTCGGAIVANDIVVTAAHCISGSVPEEYEVRVGSSYSSEGGELYPVGDLLWHPSFDFYKMDSDIAILWLSKPMVFSDKVAPIDMFSGEEEVADGAPTIVTGWGHIREGGGFPTMLQKVIVPKVNEELCNEAYKPTYSITSRMLCAGAPEGGKDACQGDSGGPLVYNNKLAGIVSWGLGCARPDYPGVYAKVSALRQWLDDNIASIRLRHLLRRA